MVFLIVISTISCSKHGKVVDTASTTENAFEIEKTVETVEIFAAYRVYEQDGPGEYAGPVKIMETIETNIDYVEEIKPALLLKTKTGCPKTELEIKHDFFYGNTKEIAGVAARTINELNILRKNYLDLPYLDEFTEKFFENNILFFVITFDDDWVIEVDQRGDKYEVHVAKDGLPAYKTMCMPPYGLYVLRFPKS
jgi:hypothetical protein